MGEGIPFRRRVPEFMGYVAGLRMLPLVLWVALAHMVGAAMAAPTSPQQPVNTPPPVGLHVAVVDENGAAVPSARITLTPLAGNANTRRNRLRRPQGFLRSHSRGLLTASREGRVFRGYAAGNPCGRTRQRGSNAEPRPGVFRASERGLLPPRHRSRQNPVE